MGRSVPHDRAHQAVTQAVRRAEATASAPAEPRGRHRKSRPLGQQSRGFSRRNCPMRKRHRWRLDRRRREIRSLKADYLALPLGLPSLGISPHSHISAVKLLDVEGSGLSHEVAQLCRGRRSVRQKSENRFESCWPTSPALPSPSSLSICEMAFFKIGIAALGGRKRSVWRPDPRWRFPLLRHQVLGVDEPAARLPENSPAFSGRQTRRRRRPARAGVRQGV